MAQLALTPCRLDSPTTAGSPLANSTCISQTCASSNGTNIIINNYSQIVINKTTAEEKVRKPRKSIAAGKKSGTSKKTLVPKKTTSNVVIKSGGSASNVSRKISTVEQILGQINMGKYANLFKNYDLNKFKEMRELDLNAMGITRPQELRTFKEAINKVKADSVNALV